MLVIQQATAEDVGIWRDLRRDGILRYPHAFLPSLEQHDASDPQQDAARLSSGGKFLAVNDDAPVTRP